MLEDSSSWLTGKSLLGISSCDFLSIESGQAVPGYARQYSRHTWNTRQREGSNPVFMKTLALSGLAFILFNCLLNSRSMVRIHQGAHKKRKRVKEFSNRISVFWELSALSFHFRGKPCIIDADNFFHIDSALISPRSGAMWRCSGLQRQITKGAFLLSW